MHAPNDAKTHAQQGCAMQFSGITLSYVFTQFTFLIAGAQTSCKNHLSAGHSSSGLYPINMGGSSFKVSTLRRLFSRLDL